ncbi:ABC transporter permease [Vibrio coralliilyticus]|uniref:ABC transporter permease n=1 Tax=Vibrio coralliilyticus TaxID=190893 RepID=A0AAN0SHL3_9VIBR|nr:ABC transporter permease [Vibrio coralliilyticus]AIW21300.1 ABC transporter permease [Vibrio coralliilyticus]NOH40900.1 ABC transporter permease [Vibrio coralliilyticus]
MGTTNSPTLNRRLFSWSLSEIRHGQLWPVSIALTLIIACIFALTALAERMEQVVVKQGKEALTADTVFATANPIPDTLYKATNDAGLVTSTQTRFATMAFSDQSMKLIMVKSVDSAYPLRGEMVLSDDQQEFNTVKPGELWLDERLFSQLDVTIGDSVTVGDADFTVTGRIIEEPGLSFNPFQQMPSAFIHNSDLDKTGAVQLGSRVRFSLFINGEESDIEQVKQSIELTPSDRWRDQNSASRTNEVFQRTEQYLSLTVAIVVIMAATTLVLTCQHYVATRRKTISMLKSLGASKRWISRWLGMQVVILLTSASVIGVIIGIALEYLLRIPLVDLLPNPLPSYGLQPAFLSIITSILIAVPALGIPLLSLLNVSAVDVMQPQATTKKGRKTSWLILVPIVPMLFVYRENTLVWIVLGGMIALFAALAVVSLIVTRMLGRLPLSTSFKLALSRINRSSLATGIQFGALALSLMLLAVMWLVRTDLLSDWQKTIPENAPNAFALNIAPYEKDAYLSVLDEHEIERSRDYPIIRGRLTEINGIDAKEQAQGEEGSDVLRREINFTFGTENPEHNTILQGEWSESDGVSVESDVAEDFNLKLGDELKFVINSQVVTAKVNSIRHVEWRDMKPNFYFIFTPDVLESIPATYLVSFRVEDQHNGVLNELSRSHPTVSLMDIRSMGAKIQELLTQIVWSITVLAALGVIAGVLLIFTLLRLSLGQRQSEIQLYRTLGASKKRVTRTIWAEYGLMALVAGLIATIGAEAVVGGIMSFGFDLSPNLHFSLWFALPLVTFCTLALVVNSLIKRLLVPINKEFS